MSLADDISALMRQVELLTGQVADLPVRYAEGGGGGTVTGDLDVHFGRVETTIMGATGWLKAEWGQGQVQELDAAGGLAGNPFTIYTRFFERILKDTPVWFVYLDATIPVVLVPGCFNHAP